MAEKFEESEYTLETLSDDLADLQGRVEVQHAIILAMARYLVDAGIMDANDLINRVNHLRHEPVGLYPEATEGWAKAVRDELDGLFPEDGRYPSPSDAGGA